MVIGIDAGPSSKPYAVAAKRLGIPYVLIDCTNNDVLKKVEKVDALIWHWTQNSHADKRIALSVIKSAELMGKAVYPNTNTCWMFDDKVAEKYLLEAVNAPLVDSYVFFTEEEALKWIKGQKLPVVYKLPQGAGSTNVRLVNNMKDAKRICKMHFSLTGRPEIDMRLYYANKKNYFSEIVNMQKKNILKYSVMNRGYIYFQKYLSGNKYDIRVTIIGNRAVIFKRKNREGDFRASGSGMIDYNVSGEDLKAIPIAQDIVKKIKAQTMAFDFIYDWKSQELAIVEMSYGFVPKAVKNALGWYDDDLNFHLERTDVNEYIIKQLLSELG